MENKFQNEVKQLIKFEIILRYLENEIDNEKNPNKKMNHIITFGFACKKFKKMWRSLKKLIAEETERVENMLDTKIANMKNKTETYKHLQKMCVN